MSYSPELGRSELPRLSGVMKKVGSWALAGVLVAGGATIAVAYHDLKQGVDGPVFDMQRAETHALDAQNMVVLEEDSWHADPAQFNTAQFFTS